MRLKIEFKYQCEVEVRDGETILTNKNLNKDNLVPYLSNEINKFFLSNDGRTEAGGVVDFDYKLED